MAANDLEENDLKVRDCRKLGKKSTDSYHAMQVPMPTSGR